MWTQSSPRSNTSAANASDPRDVDHDGMITVLDGRLCTLEMRPTPIATPPAGPPPALRAGGARAAGSAPRARRSAKAVPGCGKARFEGGALHEGMDRVRGDRASRVDGFDRGSCPDHLGAGDAFLGNGERASRGHGGGERARRRCGSLAGRLRPRSDLRPGPAGRRRRLDSSGARPRGARVGGFGLGQRERRGGECPGELRFCLRPPWTCFRALLSCSGRSPSKHLLSGPAASRSRGQC